MTDVIYLDDWKHEKVKEIELYLPSGFSDIEDFLKYCETHSQTPRALFHVNQIRAVHQMARVSINDFPEEILRGGQQNFYSFHSEDMEPLLEKIRNRIKYCAN